MGRKGLTLLTTFAVLAFWGTLASGQPLLESDIVAFQPKTSIGNDLVTYKLSVDPGIVARRPEVEFELMAWQLRDHQKNMARMPKYKEEVRSRLINYKPPITGRLPEFEADITGWRMKYKEELVARRISFREVVSWQPPAAEERYAAAAQGH
jgi:hypothetical protein